MDTGNGMTDQPRTTDGDRAAAALTAGAQRALANGNMGQIDAYRCNQVILLIEQVRAEERERCAKIVDSWREIVGSHAASIADNIRSED